MVCLRFLSAQAEWDFRGTPNGWANTPLEYVSGSEYTTCQTFGSDNPRFKIDRYGNWNEAYPSADYTVSPGSYEITFNSDSKYIALKSVASCSSTPDPVWCFRGTANGWQQTPLALSATPGLYELTQAFTGQETPARFKIAACSADGSWGENYPTQDFVVADNKNYAISFNASSHEIKAAEVVQPVKPELAITPANGEFDTDSLNVTLSYSGVNITDSRYLIGTGDATQGTVFSNGDIISVGAELQIGQSLDLQVYVANAQGAVSQTYTYTKVEAAQAGFIVCVEGLSQPTIHHWNALPVDTPPDSIWPGDAMIEVADGLFSYSFIDTESSNMLFSESGNNKTPDLTRASDGTYHVSTGSWTDGCDIPTQDADVSIDVVSPTFSTDDVSVTLHATGDNVIGGRYTVDGSDPVNGIAFNHGTVIVVGADLAIDESMQVCLWAENSDSSANECFTLTKIAPPSASDFTWDNASVYFVITDRFKDGNSSNNNSYGRPSVDATGKNIGTFHGGDIAG